MGEVWPAAHITELCLQLTAGSRPVNGDEHRALGSQSCERALLTTGDFTFTFICRQRIRGMSTLIQVLYEYTVVLVENLYQTVSTANNPYVEAGTRVSVNVALL